MTNQTRTKRRKMTKAELEERRIERVKPLAKAVLLEIWTNPGKHVNQDSLASHFGVTKARIKEAMVVVLDHEVPLGYWVEPRPYRVVTYTDSTTFTAKMGYMEKTFRYLGRTAKSFDLKDNPVELQSYSVALQGAAMMMEGLKQNICRGLETMLTEEYKREQIEGLRAEVERQEALVESLS